jgi:hypothetical protein
MYCVESGQQAATNDSQESAAPIFRAVSLLRIEVAGSGKMLVLTHHAEYTHITKDSNL